MVKNILIASWTFPPEANGVAHVAYAHAKEFVRLGYNVTIATSFNPRRYTPSDMDNINVVEFDIQGSYLPHKGYSGDVDKYKNFIANFPAEVIMFHCLQAWCTDLAVPVLHKILAKKILVSHGVSVNTIIPSQIGSIRNWLLSRPYAAKISTILQKFDHITFLSDIIDKDRFYDRWLMDKLNLTHYSIIPNGANMEKFHRSLPNFKDIYQLKSEKMLLCVSNYSKSKNQELVLKSFLESAPENSTLVFIGSEFNSYSQKLNNIYHKSQSRKSSAKVVFLEKVSQEMICSAYKCADLFLFSSKTEVQPLVILDAMAAGLPFISTNVGCISKMPGGLISENRADMKKNIMYLLSNNADSHSLGLQGINSCLNHFRWDMVAESYENIFNKIL